ncbi:hypothetical protein [Yinghuangia aomiensis]|uniref:hypothetical protein n=1 Tax=Yinghuangia aomiensis TaxID=676205 RepID=UPI0031E9A2B6
MTETEHARRRQFLDALAGALIEEDDIWQIETSSDGSALVARADDQDGLVVALIEAGSLDDAVTVEDVVRVESLASGVGVTAFEGRPAAFLCSRREPAEGAVQAAYLRNMRILHVRSTGPDTWGRDVAVLSHQEFTQPLDAAVLDEREWQEIHDGSDRAVFHDGGQNPIATFAGLRAELAWHEETEVSPWGSAWGTGKFEMPAGTVMTVPGERPLPVTGVTLRFHKETRPVYAASEEGAFADVATGWLWG